MKLIAFLTAAFLSFTAHAAPATLLNVSYDPTREFYQEYNALFAQYWKGKAGQDVNIRQSHGGSAKQARSVIEGLEADVVTLALGYDIDAIAKAKRLPETWRTLLPHGSAPYSSTVVFLVRKGNPKNIRDWDDLAKPGVTVLTPNPKTSGGARWNHLAAWAYFMDKYKGDEAKATESMRALYANVPMLDTGARASATNFVQRNMGDVLITWENEAYLAQALKPKAGLEIVTPSYSIKAEMPVAVVETNARKHGTQALAEEYLRYMFSKPAQELALKHHYRPSDTEVKTDMPTPPKLMTVEGLGGWQTVQKKHFADGALFDQLYKK